MSALPLKSQGSPGQSPRVLSCKRGALERFYENLNVLSSRAFWGKGGGIQKVRPPSEGSSSLGLGEAGPGEATLSFPGDSVPCCVAVCVTSRMSAVSSVKRG